MIRTFEDKHVEYFTGLYNCLFFQHTVVGVGNKVRVNYNDWLISANSVVYVGEKRKEKSNSISSS